MSSSKSGGSARALEVIIFFSRYEDSFNNNLDTLSFFDCQGVTIELSLWKVDGIELLVLVVACLY